MNLNRLVALNSYDGTSKKYYEDENGKTFKEETFDYDYNLIDTIEF